MPSLSLSDFSARLGEPHVALTEAGPVTLVLSEANPLAGGARESGAFSLVFTGPREPALGQGVYPMEAGGARFEIFIVPVGMSEEARLYEAVFN